MNIETTKVKTLIMFLETCNPESKVFMQPDNQLVTTVAAIGTLGGSSSLLDEDGPIPAGSVCLYESFRALS